MSRYIPDSMGTVHRQRAAIPSLQGELEVIVHDREGRCRHHSKSHNRVLHGGLSYVVKCLAGRVGKPNYRIAIGSSSEPTDEYQVQLFQGILEQRLSRPIVSFGRAIFREVFEAPEEWFIAEAGLVFEDFEANTAVLYNRALLEPPVRLLRGEVLMVNFTVLFRWVGGSQP